MKYQKIDPDELTETYKNLPELSVLEMFKNEVDYRANPIKYIESRIIKHKDLSISQVYMWWSLGMTDVDIEHFMNLEGREFVVMFMKALGEFNECKERNKTYQIIEDDTYNTYLDKMMGKPPHEAIEKLSEALHDYGVGQILHWIKNMEKAVYEKNKSLLSECLDGELQELLYRMCMFDFGLHRLKAVVLSKRNVIRGIQPMTDEVKLLIFKAESII